jgi:hypothetical protein
MSKRDNSYCPTYPIFTNIQPHHKSLFDSFVSKYGAVDDFLFSTLYTWKLNGFDSSFSLLNGNLVVKCLLSLQKDDLGVSFLGCNDLDNTIITLLNDYKKLELVPQVCSPGLVGTSRYIVENKDMYADYIYSIKDIALMSGREYARRRREYNYFNRSYSTHHEVICVDVSNEKTAKELLRLYDEWADYKSMDPDDIGIERVAFMNYLNSANNFEYVALVVLIDGLIVGFQINELLPKGQTYVNFNKYRGDIKGLSTFLMVESAKVLDAQGYTYLNFGCDVGLYGLREYKESLRPIKRVSKFDIVPA